MPATLPAKFTGRRVSFLNNINAPPQTDTLNIATDKTMPGEACTSFSIMPGWIFRLKIDLETLLCRENGF